MGLYPRRQWADSQDQRKELRVSIAQISPSLHCFDALQMCRTSGDVPAPRAELCLAEEGVWVPGVPRPLLAWSQGPSWVPAAIRERGGRKVADGRSIAQSHPLSRHSPAPAAQAAALGGAEHPRAAPAAGRAP